MFRIFRWLMIAIINIGEDSRRNSQYLLPMISLSLQFYDGDHYTLLLSKWKRICYLYQKSFEQKYIWYFSSKSNFISCSKNTNILFCILYFFMRTSKKQNLIAFVVAKKLFALDDIPWKLLDFQDIM